MRVGDPVNVLENPFPERWHNIKVLLFHLLDLEKSVDHIKSSPPTILISYIIRGTPLYSGY